MKRRDFIQTSGAALIGTAALRQTGCVQMADKSAGLPGMLTHFGVTRNDLQKVIAVALEKGGDYADLYFEHTLDNGVGLQDGEVNRASSDIQYGVGIRVVAGDQTGYAYVENVSMDEMLKAARTASRIASGSAKTPPVKVDEMEFRNRYPVVNSWEEVNIQAKMPYLQKLNDRVFELDPRVTKVNASIYDTTSYILYYNSEGTLCHDYRPMAIVACTCIMQAGDRIENNYSSRASRRDFSFLADALIEEIAQEVVKNTAILFEAIKPKGGEMPVVMAAGSSGILLHEAIGHAFEADFNRKNISIFSDKLNRKICDERINVVDDGTIAGDRGSINFDDEGVESQKTYIVKDGVLNSYLHDRISARHYGVAPTGNGRRESFKRMPIPRMRVTYMENGDRSEADIIAGVKQGVYVNRFSNGQVNIGAGDFTFFVKNGYLIENGRLTQPVKDVNIIGNGPKALADITMVGDNLKIESGAWTCGKDGQSAPVGQGLPSVLVKQLTVGGD
ncbi:MAG: TldD/PmbA family protein [Acidobacteriota bacterium]|jgi:TldD protein|nr:TldD/PmbA family protein [Acidobacteriota bacterium]